MQTTGSFLRVLLPTLLTLSCALGHANVLGDMQTFAPNTDGLDFISVHSQRPLTKGWFAFGGHLSLARDHQMAFSNLTTQERFAHRDWLLEFDLDVAYALTDRVSLFFAVPTLLYQQPDENQQIRINASRGVHSFRPGFKWTIGEGAGDFAFIGSVDINDVNNSPHTGTNAKPIYNLEFAKTFSTRGGAAYGLNAGYRIRTPGPRPTNAYSFPLEDQITFSAGRSAPYSRTARWVLEAIASWPVDKTPYNSPIHAASFDLLAGMKHRLRNNLNFDWGATVEPFVDSQSPAFRVFAGLVYYWNPGWFDDGRIPPSSTYVSGLRDGELGSEVGRLGRRDAGDADDEGEATADRAPVDPGTLVINPREIEVFEGTVVRYVIDGGVAPYTYRLLQGSGKLDPNRGVYRTPLMPETALIEICDGRGACDTATIITKVAPKADREVRLKNLNFVSGTDTLIKSSQIEIDRAITSLREKKISRIIVEGHTDSVGPEDYNFDLSEKRAAAVGRILSSELGLRKDQINAIGFGEARPIATNKTPQGRQINRRCVLKVYYR